MLDGGTGITLYYGGTGTDTFVLHNDPETDWIGDFELGTDIIGLADGLTYSDLNIIGKNHAYIFHNEDRIAVIKNINSSDLSATDFTII